MVCQKTKIKRKKKYWLIKKHIDFLRKTIAQVKPDNTSENLQNEICEIIYSLYWGKEITKKVYNNTVIISNRLQYSYDRKSTIFLWILEIVKHLILTDLYLILQIKNKFKNEWKICCSIKYQHLPSMEKYKNVIQKK